MSKNTKIDIIFPSDTDILTYIRENGLCDIASIEKSTLMPENCIIKSIERLEILGYLQSTQDNKKSYYKAL